MQIPNGLDLAEFSKLPERGKFRAKLRFGKKKTVVYLGQISPRKGVNHLVEAFCGGNMGSAQLLIAGNDMGGMEEARRKAGGAENIHFLGLLKGRERLELLADADVLVYASKNEI